jgi:hypothetical protein
MEAGFSIHAPFMMDEPFGADGNAKNANSGLLPLKWWKNNL